jgi:TRAP-type C4-dicarboxylate transport system permease small subunit
MKIVRLIDRGLSALVTVLLVCSFTLMLALAASQVVLRQVLHANLPWGDLAARHLVVWVGFFGAALASRRGQHFHIGFIARLLGPKSQPWLHAAADVVAVGVCAVLVVASWTFVTVGLDPKATLFLGIRQTTSALIVPGGFGLMAVQFALRVIQSLGKALRGESEEEPA